MEANSWILRVLLSAAEVILRLLPRTIRLTYQVIAFTRNAQIQLIGLYLVTNTASVVHLMELPPAKTAEKKANLKGFTASRSFIT